MATMSTTQPDLYISADVETDGPIPGPYSMLSFGLAVVGSYDGHHFERRQAGDETFYRELRPISERFQDEALALHPVAPAVGLGPHQNLDHLPHFPSRLRAVHEIILTPA